PPAENTAPAAPPINANRAALPVENRGLLTIAVMGASIVQFLDATIANVAIPHMQTSLGATFDSVTWVLTSFIIASAVATPLTGWLADRVGSRTLFLWAVGGFLLTSMLCGIATNLTEMVLFRIAQGVFAAFIGPLSQTIMLDINRPSDHARAMAIWGMGVMVAPISGPMIGGWLTESYSWRWVFYINIPIGIPTLIILWWLLPSRPIARRRLDYTGYALFAIGLAALQLVLDRGQGEDWFQSPEIIIEAIVAASALWMFIVHILHAREPLFPAALVRNSNFATALGFMALMGVVLIALAALLPPMMQRLFGYSVLDTGLLMAPRGVGVLLAMIIASRSIAIVGPRVLVGAGFTIVALSLWHMTGWTLEMPWQEMAWTGLAQGLGLGLCFMPLSVIAFATVPVRHRTDGSGLLNLMRSIGASAGISLITTMLARNIQTSHADLVGWITPYNMPAIDLSSADRLGEYGQGVLLTVDGLINRQAAMIAYLDDFWMLAILVASFVPLVLLLKSPKLGAGAPPPPME
ncbi:MAG: DHA2 family efflux MFS transporter permease subunit, partial [Sphingopyxis sp.]